jgi:hypothetical protein
MVGRTGGRKSGRKKGGRTDVPVGRETITHAANVAQMNPVGYAIAIIVGKCEQKRKL